MIDWELKLSSRKAIRNWIGTDIMNDKQTSFEEFFNYHTCNGTMIRFNSKTIEDERRILLELWNEKIIKLSKQFFQS